MRILGIETSCDETASAVLEINEKSGLIIPLSNIVSSQVKLHTKWGGVVPTLAAREHLKNILPVIQASLDAAHLTKNEIDLIAVTNGPGLAPALLVGANTAKTLSFIWQKPLLGVHHIEGHIYANLIKKDYRAAKFPILCLIVSGGHTQLILIKKHLHYTIIGETQDDAAGEAFDKVARILNLGYPGGPLISKLASQFNPTNAKYAVKFPRPMINTPDFNFSFSGLKTAVLYFVKKNQDKLADKKFIQEVAYEFQQAVIDTLIAKTIRAAKTHKPRNILLAGGVSANTELQKQLAKAIAKNYDATAYQTLDITYSLDNAAMIAAAAFFRYKRVPAKKSLFATWKNMRIEANLKLK